jgi:hypothetical protein
MSAGRALLGVSQPDFRMYIKRFEEDWCFGLALLRRAMLPMIGAAQPMTSGAMDHILSITVGSEVLAESWHRPGEKLCIF